MNIVSFDICGCSYIKTFESESSGDAISPTDVVGEGRRQMPLQILGSNP